MAVVLVLVGRVHVVEFEIEGGGQQVAHCVQALALGRLAILEALDICKHQVHGLVALHAASRSSRSVCGRANVYVRQWWSDPDSLTALVAGQPRAFATSHENGRAWRRGPKPLGAIGRSIAIWVG